MSGALAPQVPKKHRDGASVFMIIGVVIFVASLLSIGGTYLWKQYLLSAQMQAESDLAQRQTEFKIDQISLIKAQATKISLAKNLLNNHLVSSKIFSVISQLTAENVRFLSMDLAVPVGAQGPFQLTLTGYGRDFQSVAFQSDVLNQLDKYGLRTIIKNAIVSDPSLNRNGTVSFGFTAQIDPVNFSYVKNLSNMASPAAAVDPSETSDSQIQPQTQ